MTRAQKRAAKRIADIRRLCVARAKAEMAHRRDRVKEIDAELQPKMTEQLAWELRQDRKLTADGWQDFPSEAYGDARQ